MRMKSYFADSVQEAIDKAREELGSDAMLMSSRSTEPELKELGAYEVVFGLAPLDEPDGSPPPAHPSMQQDSAFSRQILRELSGLRDELEQFRHSFSRSAASQEWKQFTPDLIRIFERLVSGGFSTQLAHEVTETIAPRIEPHRRKSVRMIRAQRDVFARDLQDAFLAEEIESRFETAPSLGSGEAETATVLLVGPPGSGKTSSLVKLAFREEARQRRSVQFLSTDTLRVGASDQLNSFARILGARFDVVDSFPALPYSVAELGARRFTLIDSPGFAPGDEAHMEALAQAAQAVDAEVHLVLPATLSLRAAELVWKRFAVFQPAKLLVTHVDEVESAGSFIEFAIRAGLPLSFLATGQQIPEDLGEARKPELTQKLLPAIRAVSVAA